MLHEGSLAGAYLPLEQGNVWLSIALLGPRVVRNVVHETFQRGLETYRLLFDVVKSVTLKMHRVLMLLQKEVWSKHLL